MTDVQSRAGARMSDAAQDFLDGLDDEQRKAAQWPFPADGERLRWYYTPTDHGGLPLSGMRPKQQQLALEVLAAGLSRPAYVTACTIIGLDNVLDELEGWSAAWGLERGRDPGLYYLRIFGEPGGQEPWSWRFGGHHISIHHVVVDGEVRASTPLFLGADPAVSPFLGGSELRPLGSTEDLGRELLTSLGKEERAAAVISPVPPFDVVGANRVRVRGGELPLKLPELWRGRFEGELRDRVETFQQQLEEDLGVTDEHLEALRLTVASKGISGEELSGEQRRMLRDIVAVYIARLPDDMATAELAKYTEEHMKKLSFAWAGGEERGVPHYYRVQGPRLLIEYDNAQRGGNHAHSVWRDPEGDFGMDILGEHHLQG